MEERKYGEIEVYMKGKGYTKVKTHYYESELCPHPTCRKKLRRGKGGNKPKFCSQAHANIMNFSKRYNIEVS